MTMLRRAWLASMATAPGIAPAWAQNFPARPLRLIIPYPPGGGTDTLARPFAERLRARIGQPVVLENRGGAATNIGMEAAARAPADGHTLVVNADNVALFPLLYRTLPYDLNRDLAPISYIASSPLVLAGNPAVPARSLGEFVALAKREPERLSFANPSIGSPHHLGFELFAREAGVRLTQVEYRGGGPALNDVLAGHVDLGVFSLGAVSQHFTAGTLRPYALLSPTRASMAPDIPTTAEQGLPAVVNALRFLIWAPAQVTREHIATLHAAITDAMADPGLREVLIRAGFETMSTTPQESAAMLRAEHDRWAAILPGLNIRLD